MARRRCRPRREGACRSEDISLAGGVRRQAGDSVVSLAHDCVLHLDPCRTSGMMDIIGGEHRDPGMAVLGVVPGEERPAEGDGSGDIVEAAGEAGVVFQGLEWQPPWRRYGRGRGAGGDTPRGARPPAVPSAPVAAQGDTRGPVAIELDARVPAHPRGDDDLVALRAESLHGPARHRRARLAPVVAAAVPGGAQGGGSRPRPWTRTSRPRSDRPGRGRRRRHASATWSRVEWVCWSAWPGLLPVR